MKYRKLDNGDYSFGGSANNFIAGTLAVGQAIKTNLLLLSGEWWEAIDKGLPLFQNILGAPGTPENTQATDMLVRDVILNTPGVIRIKDFKSTYDNRRYTITSCVAETQYGDVIVKEVIF